MVKAMAVSKYRSLKINRSNVLLGIFAFDVRTRLSWLGKQTDIIYTGDNTIILRECVDMRLNRPRPLLLGAELTAPVYRNWLVSERQSQGHPNLTANDNTRIYSVQDALDWMVIMVMNFFRSLIIGLTSSSTFAKGMEKSYRITLSTCYMRLIQIGQNEITERIFGLRLIFTVHITNCERSVNKSVT